MTKFAAASWEECLHALQLIIPSARSLGLDDIDRMAQMNGEEMRWVSLPNWEDLEDPEILGAMLGSEVIRGSDCGILVPAMCYYGLHSPFLVPYDHIKGFVAQFFVQHGESFFNGDTVILLPSYGTIYLFSHDGLYSRLSHGSKNE